MLRVRRAVPALSEVLLFLRCTLLCVALLIVTTMTITAHATPYSAYTHLSTRISSHALSLLPFILLLLLYTFPVPNLRTLRTLRTNHVATLIAKYVFFMTVHLLSNLFFHQYQPQLEQPILTTLPRVRLQAPPHPTSHLLNREHKH